MKRTYTEEQKAANKARAAAYYLKNKEKVNERCKQYREARKEAYAGYQLSYRLRHPERVAEANKARHARDVEQIRAPYLAQAAADFFKTPASEIKKLPELLTVYKTNLELKRKLKTHGTKQINRPEQPPLCPARKAQR